MKKKRTSILYALNLPWTCACMWWLLNFSTETATVLIFTTPKTALKIIIIDNFLFWFVIQQENERLKNGYLLKRRSASSDRSMAKPQITVKRHGSSESHQLSMYCSIIFMKFVSLHSQWFVLDSCYLLYIIANVIKVLVYVPGGFSSHVQ